jgi:hypothetical protein
VCKEVTAVKNITLSLDDDLLKAGREYAKKHRISFNSLIRSLLEQTVKKSAEQWLSETFDLMDSAHGDSRGQNVKREELYRV